MNRIFTGNYTNCTYGNLISISGNKGKSANFEGKYIKELAPKLEFWKVWHANIGKISEEENIKYYIEQYYLQVLKDLDIESLLENEIDPILLCYEDSNDFCHRHIVAEYVELKYGIEVKEIEINSNNIKFNTRPEYIKNILVKILNKYNKNKIMIKKRR